MLARNPKGQARFSKRHARLEERTLSSRQHRSRDGSSRSEGAPQIVKSAWPLRGAQAPRGRQYSRQRDLWQ
ncbi:hypothetical protein M6B38_142955 [Iris pallida]|uniref:Uncharacterized protein n=1 Tax=Iris pallida TaxID=29817 RepID=A0AAX6FBX9_IRIPA|nr:hypothetical protein M6B38_142955 [Iris pallida]